MAERSVHQQETVEWNIPPEFMGIMNYNPRHDIQDYLDLQNLNGKIGQGEYAQKLLQTNTRTKRQLEKALGERFGVEKSSVQYYIGSDNKLHSQDYPEPVVDRYKKGQKFLKENGSAETEREAAEVRGIEAVEQILSGRDFPASETLVIISAEGGKDSLYTETFFDLYQKNGDTFTMTRYHSTHGLEGFLQAAKKLDSEFEQPQEALTPAFFLERPIRTSMPTAQILEAFALDTKAQKEWINREIIETCTPLILSLVNTLIGNPLAIEEIKLTLNATWNLADETERKIQNRKTVSYTTTDWRQPFLKVDRQDLRAVAARQIQAYGYKPVRTVSRGCPGSQKGFKVSGASSLKELAKAIGANSVVDFATFLDDEEDEEVTDFQCPGKKEDGSDCTNIIKAYSGVKECPKCHTKATCA